MARTRRAQRHETPQASPRHPARFDLPLEVIKISSRFGRLFSALTQRNPATGRMGPSKHRIRSQSGNILARAPGATKKCDMAAATIAPHHVPCKVPSASRRRQFPGSKRSVGRCGKASPSARVHIHTCKARPPHRVICPNIHTSEAMRLAASRLAPPQSQSSTCVVGIFPTKTHRGDPNSSRILHRVSPDIPRRSAPRIQDCRCFPDDATR